MSRVKPRRAVANLRAWRGWHILYIPPTQHFRYPPRSAAALLRRWPESAVIHSASFTMKCFWLVLGKSLASALIVWTSILLLPPALGQEKSTQDKADPLDWPYWRGPE